MSVVSRIVLAGLAAASLATFAHAQAADDPNRDTKGRFMHAGKCTITFGFGGGCDKDAPLAKVAKEAKAQGEAKDAERAAATKASAPESTKSQFFHASECVVTLGFVGPCDRNAPAGSTPAASRRAEGAPATPAAPPAPDNSTRGRFLHAGKCTITFGFGGGCDK